MLMVEVYAVCITHETFSLNFCRAGTTSDFSYHYILYVYHREDVDLLDQEIMFMQNLLSAKKSTEMKQLVLVPQALSLLEGIDVCNYCKDNDPTSADRHPGAKC